MAHRMPHGNARFIIAGHCPDPATYTGSFSVGDIQEMIGRDERIHYIGHIPEVEEVYNSYDIIAVPSRGQEPLGLISLKAGARGKPVVVTRICRIPEIIQDGVSGLLVETGNAGQLSEAVKRLIENPELRHRFGPPEANGSCAISHHAQSVDLKRCCCATVHGIDDPHSFHPAR